MARITVEDCLDHIGNRFELVVAASKIARKLIMGSITPSVDWENDKATVVALREIAAGHTLHNENTPQATDATNTLNT